MIALAAMSQNFVIGRGGKLPWGPIKDDFKFFKDQTIGRKILVGRVTFETLPYLKDREIFVLGNRTDKNHRYDPDKVTFISDISEAPSNIIVCGGSKVYQSLLPRCQELLLTIVHKDYEGDTYFPQYAEHFTNPQKLFSSFDAGEKTDFSIWRFTNKNNE